MSVAKRVGDSVCDGGQTTKAQKELEGLEKVRATVDDCGAGGSFRVCGEILWMEQFPKLAILTLSPLDLCT